MKKYLVVIFVFLPLFSLYSQETDESSWGSGQISSGSIALRLSAESGFLGVIEHKISYVDGADPFSYQSEGGQDVLFPFLRFSVDAEISRKQILTLLYQPLVIETSEDMETDELDMISSDFTDGATRLLYSFPFYRLSYMYRFKEDGPLQLAAGVSLQIRNATIEFEELGDSDVLFRNSDIGPVPLLKFRGRYQWRNGVWIGSEIDGMYAPISYLNGSTNDTVGALLDASLRAGLVLRPVSDLYLNLRYLGGGATNEDPGDYVYNWLNFFSVSLGLTLELN